MTGQSLTETVVLNQGVVTRIARKASSFRAGMNSAANEVRLLFVPHSQKALF